MGWTFRLRLRFWGLFFILLLLASAAGAGTFFGGFMLGALLFYAGIVGLVVTGLVGLMRAVRFGGREGYGQPAVTLRGEVVRSNSERIIADYFNSNGINYVYEQPAMGRWGFRRISRPDFYLPDYDAYVEFWGLVSLQNDSARARYERTMRWKIARYHRNGIRFVSLYPGELGNLDAVFWPRLEQAVGRALIPL